MPRRPRYSPINIPQHVMQRGHDRQNCFLETEDFRQYLKLLKQFSNAYSVQIHAWVLMTNHVHMLVTPHQENGLSQMMQAIAYRYAQYFNKKYKRTGGLWERRFRNCVIDSDEYLLYCYIYIELNPVRAGMVTLPEEYRWTSYHENAGDMGEIIVTPHELYLHLGQGHMSRKETYRDLLMAGLAEEQIDVIRKASRRSKAIK